MAAAAAAPICFAASQAMAQIVIDDEQTAPIATSVFGDILVDEGGSVVVSDGSPAVTLDSDNTVSTIGLINVRDGEPGAVGLLVDTGAAGITGGVELDGDIAADTTPDLDADFDDDDDGDADGPFVADGDIRYGVRVIGDGVFTGDISQLGGIISVHGNEGSAAFLTEAEIDGNISLAGALGALGSDSFGLRIAAPVSGDVSISALINAQGENSSSVSIEAPIGGQLFFDGSIQTSGFRYFTAAVIPGGDPDILDADDLLPGGPAMRVAASVGGGVLIEGPLADLDPDEDDENDDDIVDSQVPAGQIVSIGPGAGLLVGAAGDIALGNVGADAREQYGLIIRGSITADGEYDGFDALGVQVGGLGGMVDTSGGIRVTSTVNVTAFSADAIGLHLASGAMVPELSIQRGTISAGVNTDDETTATAFGVRIDPGATLSVLNNNGTIRGGVTGAEGDATAVFDGAGQLHTINNTGIILAQRGAATGTDPVGSAIALDLSANTTGVALTQSENSVETIFERIDGDILFGDGDFDDTLTISAGRIFGDIDFGGGNDVLDISGEGTTIAGSIWSDSGNLAVNVASGSLALTNLNQVNLSSLNVGETGLLAFTADPLNANPLEQNTFLNVSGMATFAENSNVRLDFLSKLEETTTYTLLSAGTLVDNGGLASLSGDIPVLFVGDFEVDGNDLNVSLRRATTAELGLFEGPASAFEAFYQAFDADPEVAERFFAKRTTEDFAALYNQFLPDYAGGPFRALAETSRLAMAAQAENPTTLIADQPRSWLQEVGATVSQETVNEIPFDTGGFGIVGGIERPLRGGRGFYGVSASFQSSEIRNGGRAVGSYLAANAVSGNLYWRQHRGDLTLDSTVGVGYAWFDSVRRIVDEGAGGAQLLIREAEADWSGWLGTARVGASYNYERGFFYARPDAVLDAVYLSESGYTETGGGAAVNLAVDSRSTYETGAEIGVTVGARFGQGFQWGPEIRLAYRHILASGDGTTNAAFAAVPGSSFGIPGITREDGLVVVRAALRGHGAYSNFALEAGGEVGDDYEAYTMRLLVRFLF